MANRSIRWLTKSLGCSAVVWLCGAYMAGAAPLGTMEYAVVNPMTRPLEQPEVTVVAPSGPAWKEYLVEVKPRNNPLQLPKVSVVKVRNDQHALTEVVVAQNAQQLQKGEDRIFAQIALDEEQFGCGLTGRCDVVLGVEHLLQPQNNQPANSTTPNQTGPGLRREQVQP